MSSEQLVLASVVDRVGVITLNRPMARNALSGSLIEQLLEALKAFDENPEIAAIVLTGGEKFFCAGADIKELKELNFVNAYMTRYLKNLNDGLTSVRKPVIAAVNGFAFGGGCELAMMCDIIYAGDSAKFGQPEVKIGTIPGAGGTQRLLRAIGKVKTMELVLTGEAISAQEAEAYGLVSKVFPSDQVVDKAVKLGHQISLLSAPVIAMAKEAVNEAEEMSLKAGLTFERRLYHATFTLEDSKEGMGAFLERRAPQWKNA